jgi:hypothetical protein
MGIIEFIFVITIFGIIFIYNFFPKLNDCLRYCIKNKYCFRYCCKYCIKNNQNLPEEISTPPLTPPSNIQNINCV